MKSKIFSTLAAATTLVGMAINPGSAQAASFTIDSFTNVSNGQQSVIRGGPGTQVTINEQPGTIPGFSDIVGGYRDVWLQAVSGTSNLQTKTAVGTVADGTLSFANGTGVTSWLNVTWDGNDPGADSGNPSNLGTSTNPGNFTDLRQVRRSGLGTIDLTQGGVLNAVALELLSADLGLQVEMTVYDTNGTGISTASYTFNQGVTQPTNVYFAFDQSAADILNQASLYNAVFAPAGATSGARLTNVGAINLALKATRNDVDAQVQLLRVVNTQDVVKTPEPSTLVGFGLIAGFGLFLQTKKRRFQFLK